MSGRTNAWSASGGRVPPRRSGPRVRPMGGWAPQVRTGVTEATPRSEAYVYEVNGGQWRTFSSWPPKEAEPRPIYLREDGKVAFDPSTTSGSDSGVSDPQHPIPCLARPVDGTRWHQWLVEDQRFVDNQPDVRTYVSEPLADDVAITRGREFDTLTDTLSVGHGRK